MSRIGKIPSLMDYSTNSVDWERSRRLFRILAAAFFAKDLKLV